MIEIEKNFPFFLFKNKIKFEIMLDLTYFKSIGGIMKYCGIEQKNVLKNKVQLFEDKQIFLFFAWGQAKF